MVILGMAVRQVNSENNATAAVVNNIAATSQNYALSKNDGVIHVSGHNECTYRVVSTDDQVTPANDVSTSAMKNINMSQNVLKNEKSVTFVASLSDAANTNKEDTHGVANHATKEPGMFGNSLNIVLTITITCVISPHVCKMIFMSLRHSCYSISKTQSVSKAGRLTTMTSEFVHGANVAIPLADAEEVSQRFENTLYGYFIGKRLAFTLVETYVKNAWAKFGLEQTMLTNGFFFFQFATREGLERVLENGPDAEWPKNVKVMDSNPVEDEDGVTQVKRKNGKGKQDGKAKQVAGIHLNKPKPKMVNREVQEPPTNNNDKATTSNYDSSLRKDNQPTMQPEDGINIFSLRNSFESDSLEAVLDDDDEQVEEVYIEDNVRHAKQNKGASTLSDQVQDV
nr:zinc knuckle CX2CX4HX4C [Tanacetum cinerariifolium]